MLWVICYVMICFMLCYVMFYVMLCYVLCYVMVLCWCNLLENNEPMSIRFDHISFEIMKIASRLRSVSASLFNMPQHGWFGLQLHVVSARACMILWFVFHVFDWVHELSFCVCVCNAAALVLPQLDRRNTHRRTCQDAGCQLPNQGWSQRSGLVCVVWFAAVFVVILLYYYYYYFFFKHLLHTIHTIHNTHQQHTIHTIHITHNTQYTIHNTTHNQTNKQTNK